MVRCASSGPLPLHWARRWRHDSRPPRAPIARGHAETSSTLAELMPSGTTAFTLPSGNTTPACMAMAHSRTGVSSRASRWTSSRSRSTE
eukprot:1318300-Alexandrium_andersonii.AAC.1